MTSDRIFEIIFESYGKGRVHLKRNTCNFVRECVDFKVTETEYALNTLSKGQRKPKIKYIKVKTHRKEKSFIFIMEAHHDCWL